MEPGIDRLVLASVEGLDQTVKLPAETDRYFERLQHAIDADPAAKARYPDVAAMMRRVLGRLAESPLRIDVPAGSGASTTVVIGPDEVRLFTGFTISDPDGAARMLQLYRAADQGNWVPLAQNVARIAGRPIRVSGMSEVMDVASGIGAERLALVRQQAETSLLGDLLNFPMPHAMDAFGPVDLGDEFRSPPSSARPALVLTGTLDGRTYPESQREAVSGLSQTTFVTVERAGHNLFMVSPAVGDLIVRFLRGEPVADTTISIPLADFGP
jgi:pimeloyl-ACP methyl ester carboxylesterase